MSYKIISYPFNTKNGKHVLCQCSCGKKNSIRIDRINKIKSCKTCANRQYAGKISGKYFGKIRYSAKERDIEFNLTKEYIWNLYIQQNGRCKLTGWKIDFGDGNFEQEHGVTTASLDRIDNNAGYIEGNVQWLHKDVNILKQKFGQEYIIKICKAIAENNNAESADTNRTRRELLHSISVGSCFSGLGISGDILG